MRARPLLRPARRCMSQRRTKKQKGNRGAKVDHKSVGEDGDDDDQKKIWTLWESNPRPHAICDAKHARYQLCQKPIVIHAGPAGIARAKEMACQILSRRD